MSPGDTTSHVNGGWGTEIYKAALDTAVDLLDPPPEVHAQLLRYVLLPCQLLAA